MNEILNDIKTPAYVCEEARLRANLELLKHVKDESGAKILVALKGFALSGVMDMISRYLDGATASGLYEAKFAKDFIKGEIHTYSPAFKDEEIDEILSLSKHIVFNSLNQWRKFKDKALASGISCGLRINPESSASPTDAYNPCARFSRLGITRANLDKFDSLDGIEGLIHISEISWERVGNPNDYVKVGQSVEAKIISIDKDRLSLSVKQLTKDPWLDEVEKLEKGQKVEGTVTRITPFGAFVQISPAVEALVHISELGSGNDVDPEKVFTLNERKEFVILDIDREGRKISLSLGSKKKKTK